MQKTNVAGLLPGSLRCRIRSFGMSESGVNDESSDEKGRNELRDVGKGSRDDLMKF